MPSPVRQDVEQLMEEQTKRNQTFLSKYPNLHIQPPTKHLMFMYTRIRDSSGSRAEFVFYADRIAAQLIESALSLLDYESKTVQTPTGHEFKGLVATSQVCGVSILRAGASMEPALRNVIKTVPLGKILIQRNEESPDKRAELFYCKLPSDIEHRTVLLLDPMLATGGSSCKAVEALLERGVAEDKIIFVNLVSSPEGLACLMEMYPSLVILTGMVDEGLNDSKYIIPGLGDFGDLYFGT